VVRTVNEIPGYQEAVAYESEKRQEAWLGLEPDLCGLPVAPLTLRKILYLNLAGNPFITGEGQATTYHVAEFLWVVSQTFQPAHLKARKRFFRRIRKMEIPLAIEGIDDYLAAAFFDSDPGADTPQRSAPKVDWISNCIHLFASNYGWSAERVLDLPYRQITQLNRCLRAQDPDTYKTLWNPHSDAVSAEWLEKVNTMRGEGAAYG